jgi:hypothetical protein
MLTVAIPAEIVPTVLPNVKDSKDIAGHLTVGKTTENPSEDAGCVNLKKPWATLVQTSFLL